MRRWHYFDIYAARDIYAIAGAACANEISFILATDMLLTAILSRCNRCQDMLMMRRRTRRLDFWLLYF